MSYFPDGRLNRPIGLATSGTDVWVTEYEGHRALRYSQDGILLQEIGRAGQVDYYSRSLNHLADAAVDGAGNLWLADESVAHVVQFDASGTVVNALGRPWTCTSDNDGFCHPSGLALDPQHRLYVADTWNGQRSTATQRVRNYLACSST